MNEHEFRDTLRGAMVAGSPPPSMDGRAVLEAARTAQRRRRAALASAGSALAIVVVAVGALLVTGPNGWPGGLGDPVIPAAPPTSRTAWPTGPDGKPQQDRTATAGPHAETGAKLETDLAALVPAGFIVGPDQPAPGSQFYGSMRMHQSQFVDDVDEAEVWEHYARVPVTKGGQTGLLFALVLTAGNELPEDPCAAAKTLWAMHGPDGPIDLGWQCQETPVGSDKVAVISGHNGGASFDQWSYYRHPDGTSVFVAQSAAIEGSGLPGLAAQPLTLDALAALAVDPRFHLR
ncbi:hypothetical protein [Actinophytocola sp.]|uniref:hypothetical protein n=1 Tax=Actinophytocola sp. TaxID=1872138 RepID=UPI002D807B5E|nr:hypothetical protein [Actinophytocola sp.]HET9140000.1 hypothetical protein [Actinophytocola sp.]